MKKLVPVSVCATLALAISTATCISEESTAKELTPNDWLLSAQDDQERFQLLQRYLRGFDQPMWEIGERYQIVYDALENENYDLALYHWRKIKTTLENGYLKRPARQANADAMFLDQNWGEVNAAFESRNAEEAWDGFDLARSACMSCHIAEGVEYMNDQPLFSNTEAP